MEPVKLDFLYGGNTAEEGPKIEQSLDDIAAAAKAAQAEVQKNIASQRSVIKQIEADISSVEAKLKNAAPGKSQQALIQELNAAKRALDEEKAALAGVEAQLPKTAEKHVMLRTQIMQLKDNLAQMEMAGKRGTAEYQAMADELGRLNDQMGDTNDQAKILADDEKGFRAVGSAVTGLTGAMTAAVGVASLFGAENEELTRIQTRLQAVMAISIGIQQVSETLNKDSYFSVVLLTKAKTMWAAANLRVATTLGITAAASRVLMLTGIGVLIAAVGGLIYLYDKWSSKQDEQKKQAEETAKVQQELSGTISKGYAEEQAKIQAMRSALNSETVSREKKLGIIKKLAEQMPGYTADLDAEGNVIRENKKAIDDYMLSLEKSLRLRAAEKELAAIYEKRFGLEKLVLPDEDSGGAFAIKSSSKTPEDKLKEKLSAGAQAGIDELDAQAQKIKERIEAGGLVEIKVTKETKDEVAKEAFDSEAAITDLILDIREKRVKLEIDQQKDSLQKRLSAMRADRDAELRAITEKEADIAGKSPGGKINAEQAKELADERAKITAAYGKKEVSETEKYQQEVSDLVFSFAEERVQIAYNYNKDIEKARELGLTADADRIEGEKQQRIDAVTLGLIEETELYKTATDDKLQLSRETTELLIEDLRMRIEAEIAAGKLSKEQGEKWLKDLDKGQSLISDKKGKEKNQNNPFAQLGTAIAGNKVANDAVKNFDATGMSPEAAAVALDELKAKAASSTKEMAAAAGAALAGTQAILGSVVGGLDQLGMLTDEQMKDADNVIGMVGGAADLAMGIASGNPMQIIQGSVDLIVNGLEFFDFKNKALEKSQKQHLKNVEALTLKYEQLQRAVETALGTDVYAAQREQIANHKNQIAEYEAWLADEAKKKKRKQDADKIAETKAKIEDLKNSIEDEAKAIAEAIAQTDAKSLAGELADAITTAFMNGEDAALAFGDVAEQVMQNAVKNALKLQFLEKPMQAAVDQLAIDMEDDNGRLTDAEQAAFRKKIEDAGKIYYDQLAQYSDLFTGDSTSSKSGIQGDISNMTEQTGAALTGQISAMRLNVVSLLSNSKSSLDAVGKVLATLESIKTNTDRLNRIDETLYYMKINGIKVQ